MLIGLNPNIEYLSFLSRSKIGSETIDGLFIIQDEFTGEDVEYRMIDPNNRFDSPFNAPNDDYTYTMIFTPRDNLEKVNK